MFHKFGCPTLATFLFLSLGWENSNLNQPRSLRVQETRRTPLGRVAHPEYFGIWTTPQNFRAPSLRLFSVARVGSRNPSQPVPKAPAWTASPPPQVATRRPSLRLRLPDASVPARARRLRSQP